MRITTRLCRVFMWIFFLWTVLAQVVAMIGIHSYTPDFNMIEMILSLVGLTVGMLMFTVMKKNRTIGLIVAGVSLIFCVVAAFRLSDAFLVNRFTQEISEHVGREAGISGWDLVSRHLSNFAVVALMAVIWFLERFKKQQAERIAAGEYVGQYDLSGDALFSDKRKLK